MNRPPRAAPGRRASSQSGGRATGGPWSSGESPAPGGAWVWRPTPASALPPLPLAAPLQGVPSPTHLPYVVSNAPVGHHFQGMQGHLLGPRAILGEPMAEPVGEQEAQDHCGHQKRVRGWGTGVQITVVSRPLARLGLGVHRAGSLSDRRGVRGSKGNPYHRKAISRSLFEVTARIISQALIRELLTR